MKLSPRVYFIISGIAAALLVILLYLDIRYWSFALGIAIGTLIRGFYEENRISKNLKSKN